MLYKMKNVVQDTLFAVANPQSIPLVFFDEIKNVGDLISPYLVKKISTRATHRARTSVLPRLLGVGSILGLATPNAYVWGSGFMSPDHVGAKLTSSEKITAVRGRKTRDLLMNLTQLRGGLALGDPALLMPRFYKPDPKIVAGRIGIVPHYVDYAFASQLFSEIDPSVFVIDVRAEPEAFIDELLSCQAIISSSLHGLILSDAYNIPNAWVRFSEKIGGGTWKFYDYYSTTTTPDRSVLSVKCRRDAEHLIDYPNGIFQVSHFQESLDALIDCFPERFRYATP
jgi:pyruvyltransferase